MLAFRSRLQEAARIVIKLGSRVVTTAEGRVDEAQLAHLAEQIVALTRAGKQVVLVTSGAIRAGRTRLDIHGQHLDLPARQAAAAVGQIELMWRYREIFGQAGQPIAQVLLTQIELSDFRRYLHLRNTLTTLLKEYRVVPVLNENDSVSADGVQIGENDRLAAVVASKLEADLLLSLSDVAGYFEGDPNRDPKAKFIPVVEDITAEMKRTAAATGGLAGRGGMHTKLEAAELAMNAGVIMVVADGREPQVITRIMAGDDIGTIFIPRPAKMRARKRWIAYAAVPRGKLVVDEGAAQALLEGGKSLLPVGISEVEGEFEAGDMVSVVVDKDGQRGEIARGLANYGAGDLRKICRCRSRDIPKRLGHRDFDEAIHRDNLVVL